MKCPLDGSELQMTERSGIEIDYCPQCRGVWLDRGELDKMIERGGTQMPSQQYGERESKREGYGTHRSGKRKEGFLGDLFDF